MALQVYPLLVRGVFATYGYFLVDEESGHALLIDPGAQPRSFLEAIRDQGWALEQALLTHGHFDHFGAVEAIRSELGVPVRAHELSPRYLEDAALNLSAGHGMPLILGGVQAFSHGDVIELGAKPVLEVLHVPGHTDDSCVLFCPQAGIAFVGDTVYEGGPGLTVFPTGDAARLHASIRERLLALPGETMLLSGHSAPMTVEALRRVL